jgi:cytochrome c nitrite reductase small subunit
MSKDAIPVVERNCRRCHEEVIGETSLVEHHAGDLRCWDCHRDVPHGRVRSLSTTPGVFHPRLGIIGTEREEHNILGRPVRPEPE